MRQQGYPIEVHRVQTPDGYIVELHRIPHGVQDARGESNKPRPVAYLVHGIFRSSSDWVMNTPDNALGKNYTNANITETNQILQIVPKRI